MGDGDDDYDDDENDDCFDYERVVWAPLERWERAFV